MSYHLSLITYFLLLTSYFLLLTSYFFPLSPPFPIIIRIIYFRIVRILSLILPAKIN